MSAPEKLLIAARRMRELKDYLEATAELTKAANKELEHLEVEVIPQLMDENEIKNISIDGVGKLYQQVKVYVNVKAENRDKLHAWLRESGHEDMITETVSGGTLKSFAQEQMEQGVDLPDFVAAYKVPTAMLRRK